MYSVHRSKFNPLLQPTESVGWQDIAACNGCVVRDNNMYHMVYRAIGTPDHLIAEGLPFSSIGHAKSIDGEQFEYPTQLIKPTESWEKYGCEDPRVTKIDGMYYIFYTALGTFPLGPDGIKVAVARSKDLETIEDKHLVTPFNAKAMTLLPEKVNGQYMVIFSIHTDMQPSYTTYAYLNRLDDLWNEDFWNNWYEMFKREKPHFNLKHHDDDHIEVGAPLVKTRHGWLMIYSHMQHYFDEGKRTFGIEAVLLESNDPTKVIGQTRYPFIVPEQHYEKYGHIQKVVFPTGAIIEEDMLHVYYGAADTNIARASVNVNHLIETLLPSPHGRVELGTRASKDPILSPTNNEWEARDVFNPAAVEIDGVTYILYRAMSPNNTSTVGMAISYDGTTVIERLPEPIYVPRAPFEQKNSHPTGNSGCEDARIIRDGDRLFMTYTAYDGVQPPRVALTSIKVKDFIQRNWAAWEYPRLITPEGVDDKDACVMPTANEDGYIVMHRIKHHICYDVLPSLYPLTERVNKCIEIFGQRPGMWDGLKVGIAGPLILTEAGWLMLYHGVSERSIYRVGAAILDAHDLSKVKARSAQPIFEPVLDWELEGEIPNVVFPCGQVVRGRTLYLYYGGSDMHVGVATINLNELFERLGQPRTTAVVKQSW